MENLTHTFNVQSPEELGKYEQNKRVLSGFNEVNNNILTEIIQASGDELNRAKGVSWLKQWYIDADPALDPLVETLATTFNTARVLCQEKMEVFHETKSEADLLKATELCGELKNLVSEIEVLKESYDYRYGGSPDLKMGKTLDYIFQRNPESTYPAQNASIEMLSNLCVKYRAEVEQLTKEWDELLVEFVHKNPKIFPDLLVKDPSLKRDQPFMLAVLKGPNLTTSEKLKIFMWCEPHLQQDPEILKEVVLKDA